MSRKVLCVHADAAVRARLAELARDAGGEAVEAEPRAALKRSRGAQVALAGGEAGLDVLARLALDRPAMPRIAVVETSDAETLLAAVERVHPWALVPLPLDLPRLTGALRDALACVLEGPPTELTRPVPRPPVERHFDDLVRDRLTGAESFHYLRLRLDEELERSSRYVRPLSLLLVDVDDLRAVNDRFGRGVGDFALREVAYQLASGARAVDRVGRWAAGAFAMLLPETTAGAALGLAERLRENIAARRIEPPPQLTGGRVVRVRVTVSCGVACTICDGVSRSATLVARADAALARAKQAGRNHTFVDK